MASPVCVVIRLALADIRHEWRMSLCLVLAVAAIAAPLLLFFGLLMTALSAAAGIICLIVHLVTGALTGTAAVLVSIWLSCGIILSALGLVGE